MTPPAKNPPIKTLPVESASAQPGAARGRFVAFLLIFPCAYFFIFQAYPPTDSALPWRVANRRQISQILYENRGGRHFVTLLMSHPRVWAFKSGSHPLRIPCETSVECLGLMRKLNGFLSRGWNLRLATEGSLVRHIEFLEP